MNLYINFIFRLFDKYFVIVYLEFKVLKSKGKSVKYEIRKYKSLGL